MTAVVGILNKKAVAIAADSAASINNKIYNRALKIFTLSKYHPVGIMIYNSESFMGTPLETIIKMYRQQLGNTSYPTLIEYRNSFINYLRQRNFFVDNPAHKDYISFNIIYALLHYFSENIINNVPGGQAIDAYLQAQYLDVRNRCQVTNDTVDDFNTYTFANFEADFGAKTDEFINNLFTARNIPLTAVMINGLKNFIFEILIKKELATLYSGLVFTGFGEAEIYPSLYSIILHFGLENRLKYYEGNSVQITQNMGSSIQPFAQTDAMNTILVGIAPDLENICIENFSQFLMKYNNLLVNALSPGTPNIGAIIGGVDLTTLINEFSNSIQEAKQTKYITKLMDAVASLDKEDLAEMAESLIYLTFLQKRITFAQEDVGGAVDVAIISKGDGFIWIKRKLYFDSKLNQHFFDNYLND